MRLILLMLKINNYSTAIILSTYNGEKYILDQLTSLLNQTKLADQIYIRDDGSQDKTVDIIKGFIYENNLLNWSLLINDHNVGWRKNFVTMLVNVKEDIIFFADQDDIWEPNKIVDSVALIRKNPEIEVLVSDYQLFGESGGAEKIKPFAEKKITEDLSKVELNIDNLSIKRDGCAFVVKKELIPKILEVYNNVDRDIFGFPQAHDLATWLAANLEEKLYHTNKKLIKHRVHGTSTWANEAKKINQSVLEKNINILSFYRKIRALDLIKEGRFQYDLDCKINDLKLEIQLLHSNNYLKWFSSFRHFSSLKRYLGFLKRNIL